MDQELRQQIEELERKINNIEGELQNHKQMVEDFKNDPITRLIDNQSKNRLREITEENIFDIIWDSYFMYITNFESSTAFATTGAGATFDEGGVLLQTAASTDTSATLRRDLTLITDIDFTKQSRFRTRINISPATNYYLELGIGGLSLPNIAGHGYGFIVEDTTLYGFSQTAFANRTTKELTTVSSGNIDLDARFYPSGKIVFTVNGVEQGIITSDLPSDTPNSFFSYAVTTEDSTSRDVLIMSFEFMQSRL